MKGRRTLTIAVLASACAARGPTATPAVHRFQPPPGVIVDCRDADPVAEGRAERLEQCRGGRLRACVAIAETKRTDDDEERIIQAELQRACESDRAAEKRAPDDRHLHRDRVCSCAALGVALSWDRRERFDREALDLIDEGCADGDRDACADAKLLADLCAIEDPAAPRQICAVLREQGRVSTPRE